MNKYDDTISRQDAINLFLAEWMATAAVYIERMPSAQPEVKPISYADCANALMMMWINKVLTDGEYKKIMDKLNMYEMKKREVEER